MTVSILVKKLDNCFVVHLLESAIKRCFTGDLCSLGSNICKVIACSSIEHGGTKTFSNM